MKKENQNTKYWKKKIMKKKKLTFIIDWNIKKQNFEKKTMDKSWSWYDVTENQQNEKQTQ